MAFRFLSIILTFENFGSILSFYPLKLNLEISLEAGEGFGLNILLEKLSDYQPDCSNGDRLHPTLVHAIFGISEQTLASYFFSSRPH